MEKHCKFRGVDHSETNLKFNENAMDSIRFIEHNGFTLLHSDKVTTEHEIQCDLSPNSDQWFIGYLVQNPMEHEMD